MEILRSDVEFAKRVFLDRLTTDAQPLLQPDPGSIDQGPGDDYDYGGYYDAFNFGVGADCSGSSGIFIGATIFGPSGMSWNRLFTTETFPTPFTQFRETTQEDLVNNYYPIKVCIMRGGGGPDSHMNCSIDGVVMESSGTYGTCTLGHGAIDQDDSYWNTFYVLDATITEDTAYRCPMKYPRGLDYAGGLISGADLRAAAIAFVFRYLSDGGSSLPSKRITGAEFADLDANGIDIGLNWETTANFMLAGSAQGAPDAQAALSWYQQVSGITDLVNEVIYFSADFDATEADDTAIWNYLDAANRILGTRSDGKKRAGLYGDYYVCKRALDAGKVDFVWQTEAWSSGDDGYNIDSRVAIVQRNNAGYQTVDGIQADINEAHVDDFGQFISQGAIMTAPPNLPPVVTPPGPSTDDLILDQLEGPVDPATGQRGWAQLGNRSIVDYLSQIVGPALQQIQTTITSMQAKPLPATGPVLQVPVPKGITK